MKKIVPKYSPLILYTMRKYTSFPSKVKAGAASSWSSIEIISSANNSGVSPGGF
jgi:predicted DNA-binding transcriptional regulator AlpA